MRLTNEWFKVNTMLGLGTFIRRYSDAHQAERELMEHYAAKRKRLAGWDRRYAHMQYVLKWASLFQRHLSSAAHASSSHKDNLAA